MFERFTERARQVVVLAQQEAVQLRHNYIGTEHLLLGLLREEEGVAARALASLDVTLDHVRAEVARIIGQGDEVTTGQIPFTPRAKKVLELALREALALGHNYIGTEHILLGLVRENAVGARILHDLGADAEKIDTEVLRMLSGPGRSVPARTAPPELAGELEEIRRQKEEALELQEFERAAELREREREITRQIREQGFEPPASQVRTATHAASAHEPRKLGAAPPVFVAFTLFALALAIGVALGWAIWG